MDKPPNDEQASLYQRAVGEQYAILPPVLQRFHAQSTTGRAVGTLNIARGRGVFRYLVATLLRLPQAGVQVPIELSVEVFGAKERWTRRFDSLILVTEQWLGQGLLVEHAGPLRFGFRVTGDEIGLQFSSQCCWLLGTPLPYTLSPRVNAVAQESLAGWWVQVRIEAPLFGMLAQYEGEVIPQW